MRVPINPILFVYFFLDEPVQPSLSTNKSMPSYCKNDDGDIFLTAESWKPNVCTSCICLDGGISCYSESCPPVSCEKPVLRKGQCCPYCIGKPSKEERRIWRIWFFPILFIMLRCSVNLGLNCIFFKSVIHLMHILRTIV